MKSIIENMRRTWRQKLLKMIISDVGIINTEVIKPFSAAFGSEKNVAEAGESCCFFHVGF